MRPASVDFGNFLSGVYVQGGSFNAIGGARPGDRNIISGNTTFGVSIDGVGATQNLVEGNYIGTDATGEQFLGNEFSGVDIRGVADNVIGGLEAGAGNVISGNADSGVTIRDAAPQATWWRATSSAGARPTPRGLATTPRASRSGTALPTTRSASSSSTSMTSTACRRPSS